MSRCTAKTKSGRRCRNPAFDGSEFCRVHILETTEDFGEIPAAEDFPARSSSFDEPRNQAIALTIEEALAGCTCAICREATCDQLLSNFEGVHSRCERHLREEWTRAKSEAETLSDKSSSLLGDLERSRAYGWFRLFAGLKKPDEILKEQRAIESALTSAETQVERLYHKLKPIYDFWRGYPPDWEKRRDQSMTSAKDECSICGEEGTQVHHVIPISLGGSNLPENLQLLCYECHLEAHGADWEEWNGRSWSSDPDDLTHFRSPRVGTIRLALARGATLHLCYRDKDGVHTERQVRPIGLFEQHGKAYFKGNCELRGGEPRTFRIDRIQSLVLESSGH